MNIGKFDAESSSPTLEFECLIEANDFHKDWVRCSMLANYVAKYTAYEHTRREWAENLISTVVNDFLEAVLRLSPDLTHLTLRCVQYQDHLLLDMQHSLRPEMLEPFQTFLTDACEKNIEALYFQLLTGKGRPAPEFNQLGLIMLVHDFGARLAAHLEDQGKTVTTRVFVSTKEFAV